MGVLYKNVALIFGGGVGVRASTNGIPKQFVKVGGVPIIVRTIKKFQANNQVDAIVCVCVDGWLDHLQRLVNEYHLTKVVAIVAGGRNGQESIFNGLETISNLRLSDDAVVLIHDAVRPMIAQSLLDECVQSTKLLGSGIASVVCHETVASSYQSVVDEIFPRDELVLLKAPQCFFFKDIWQYHQVAKNTGLNSFTDSASMAKYFGHKLTLVNCDSQNIKVTYPEDVYILKILLEIEENKEIFGY